MLCSRGALQASARARGTTAREERYGPAHYREATTLKTNIDKIASATGLGVYITEYDINQADDTKQQTQYKDHFTMFMSNANIKGVTVWGYVVGATW